MESEQWSAAPRSFRTSWCLASFTLTHWLHFEVPEVQLFWISVTQKSGQDSGETFSLLQRGSGQQPRNTVQWKCTASTEVSVIGFENLANAAPNMHFVRNVTHFSHFFVLIYFSYTFQLCNISFLRKNILQPKELTFVRFQILCCVPDKWSAKAFPYSVWGVYWPRNPWSSHLPGVWDHDELSPTLASDCFLTFNLVSSCAWMNMAMLWISALMYTSSLEEQASASCGN